MKMEEYLWRFKELAVEVVHTKKLVDESNVNIKLIHVGIVVEDINEA